jgi:hypothetical protein
MHNQKIKVTYNLKWSTCVTQGKTAQKKHRKPSIYSVPGRPYLEQLQQFCIFCLAKDGVCQLSNQYGEEKKSYVQRFGKIDLPKSKKETCRRGREERTRE